MLIRLKALLQRPFKYADLRQDADHFFARPPLPPELRDALATVRGESGESLLDHWRRFLNQELEAIANEPTWNAQRASLIRAVLRENTWRALYVAVQDSKFPQSWAHLVDGTPVAAGEQSDRKSLLFQRWILAVTTQACLVAIGGRCYRIDEQKNKECDVHYLVDLETKRLDIGILDYAMSLADKFDDEQAFAVAEFKDEHVNPLVSEQIRTLQIAEEQITHGELDVAALKQSLNRIQQRKQELHTMLAGVDADSSSNQE